jgi:methylamine dehydrogenase accessory protein MauD
MTAPFYLSYAVLWALVILLSFVLLGLVRAVYRLQHEAQAGSLARTNGHMRGRQAPAFSGIGVSGEQIQSSDFAGRLTGLLFVGPDCGACEMTLNDLDALKTKTQQNLVVVCRGEQDECNDLSDSYRLTSEVVVDRDLAISDLFEITSVPTAVLIGEDGRIRSYGHPLGRGSMENLLAGEAAEEYVEGREHQNKWR